MRLASPEIHSPLEDLANTVEGALQYERTSNGNIRAGMAVGGGTQVSGEGSTSKFTHLYGYRHAFMAIALPG